MLTEEDGNVLKRCILQIYLETHSLKKIIKKYTHVRLIINHFRSTLSPMMTVKFFFYVWCYRLVLFLFVLFILCIRGVHVNKMHFFIKI